MQLRERGSEGGRKGGRREGVLIIIIITCTPISHSDLHWSLISTKLEESIKCESGSFIAVIRSDLNN